MSTRSYIRVSGGDRIDFLQRILTQDVSKLAAEKIQFAAMLTPQGKLFFDMFLIDEGDSILIDTATARSDMLIAHLKRFKLRAKVTLDAVATPPALTLPDPRHAALPPRVLVQASDAPFAERLALGIPDFLTDIEPDSMTAMDAGYDLLNAISFTKGCYVGQEVTARMHYKAIARKGFFMVHATQPLTSGASVTHDQRTVGTLSSAQGTAALAFLKFEDATTDKCFVDSQPIKLLAPGWMQPKLALFENAGAKQ